MIWCGAVSKHSMLTSACGISFGPQHPSIRISDPRHSIELEDLPHIDPPFPPQLIGRDAPPKDPPQRRDIDQNPLLAASHRGKFIHLTEPPKGLIDPLQTGALLE